MYTIKRRKSRIIKIGSVSIGDNSPVAIQSMTKTDTKDIAGTIRQIKELESCGCEIIRLSIKDFKDAKAIRKIKPQSKIPLVADIHFDFRLALEAIDNGIDKIRLNPGNIYKRVQIKEIVRAAKNAGIPIRIGVNSGSLKSHGRLGSRRSKISDIMVKNASDYIKILEGCGFYNTVVSLKASNIFDTVQACCKMANIFDYPFHLGITATGSADYGIIKSAIVLGILFYRGIGDTIRISLTDHPKEEVKAAKLILQSLGLRNFKPEIISCPTCGRCEVDLIGIVKKLEKNLINYRLPSFKNVPKVAVMGCVVNGPGEASEADLGIAFGKRDGLLFKSAKPIKKIPANSAVKQLLSELENWKD